MALVERWRPETHTFMLPHGECTVTLQDMGQISGLPIDGNAVTGTTGQPWQLLCQDLLGLVPNREVMKGNTVALTWLRDTAIYVVAHLSNGNSFDCQILAFDFHYNIAALKIQSESDAPLPTACLAHLDDSISVDPNQLYIPEEKPFQLLPHSKSFNLIPGDTLIVLGRYFIKPYDVMATIGEFRVISSPPFVPSLSTLLYFVGFPFAYIHLCGIGGPFINYYGEVIGICFHDLGFTPFLPINVASKWWEHYKRCGRSIIARRWCRPLKFKTCKVSSLNQIVVSSRMFGTRRPWLGMEVTNLYAADVNILEKIIQKFPNVFKGVIVEEVMAGSSADSAGISPNDVIVQFGGKTIKSFLELFEAMWDKVGDPVEVIVIPASNSVPLRLSMVVDEATSNNLYR
uniref:PDZ domain-containing protein n=1 Tax=Manihot esculenta TaxID=3983 RepID=A0A2C9VZU4_MANES